MEEVDLAREPHNSQLTLRDLVAGGHALVFECTRCRRRHTLNLAELIRDHGPDTTVAYVRRHTACDICGPKR